MADAEKKILLDFGVKGLTELNKDLDETNELIKLRLTYTDETKTALRSASSEEIEQMKIVQKERKKDYSLIQRNFQAEKGSLADLSSQLSKKITQLRKMGDTGSDAYKKTKAEVITLRKQVGDLEASYGTFSRNVGNYGTKMIDSFKQMGIFLAAGALSMRTFKSAIESTQISADGFAVAMEVADRTTQAFLRTIISGDFGNLVGNLISAAKAGKDYAIALDEIADKERAVQTRRDRVFTEIKKLRQIEKDAENDVQDRLDANLKANELLKEILEDVIAVRQQAFDEARKNLITEFKLTEEQGDLAIRYIEEYDKLTENQLQAVRAIVEKEKELQNLAVPAPQAIESFNRFVKEKEAELSLMKGLLTEEEARFYDLFQKLGPDLNLIVDKRRDAIAKTIKDLAKEQQQIDQELVTNIQGRTRLLRLEKKELSETEPVREKMLDDAKKENEENRKREITLKAALQLSESLWMTNLTGIEKWIAAIESLRSKGLDPFGGMQTQGLMDLFPEDTETVTDDPFITMMGQRLLATQQFAQQAADAWRDSYKQQLDDLETLHQDGMISEGEYLAGKATLRRQRQDEYISLLKDAAGQNIKLQQAIAVAEQAINVSRAFADIKIALAVGKAKAAAAAPPPGNFVLIATFLAQVAGLIGQVIAIRNQKPQAVRGFSEGGYTGIGGRHEPAGIVHKGEVVWSQRDVAMMGGAQLVNSLRPTFKGYADGGIVGVSPNVQYDGLVGRIQEFLSGIMEIPVVVTEKDISLKQREVRKIRVRGDL